VKLNKEDKDYLFDFIIKNMDDKSDYYKEQAIKSMIFSYTIKKGKAKNKVSFESSNLNYQNYQHYKFPITMNPLQYGKLIRKIDELNLFIIQVNKTNIVDIIQKDNKNIVKFYKEGDITYEYIDYKIDESSFYRVLNNKKFTFVNNELVLLTIDKSVKYIKPLLEDGTLTNKIITMDIETFVKDRIMIPYNIS
jgi:hypothetical protein